MVMGSCTVWDNLQREVMSQEGTKNGRNIFKAGLVRLKILVEHTSDGSTYMVANSLTGSSKLKHFVVVSSLLDVASSVGPLLVRKER